MTSHVILRWFSNARADQRRFTLQAHEFKIKRPVIDAGLVRRQPALAIFRVFAAQHFVERNTLLSALRAGASRLFT